MSMRPAPRLLHLLWGWMVLALIVVMAARHWPGAMDLWIAAGIVILLLCAWDIRVLLREPSPAVVRGLFTSQPVGVWRIVRLCATNPTSRVLRVTLYDHHPPVARTEGLPMRLCIPPGGEGAADYRIVFEARGEQVFSQVDTLVPGPLGLFLRRRLLALPHTVRVYPDFAAVAKYALLATDHRLSRIGIRERRRRGEGLEFHQLREYREGDVLRQVDWKATSRLRKLISREYQDERDQQVLFLLDCSNRMRAKDGALTHFDEALNALLLLAHVALRQGDGVGSVSFGAEARVIAPRKGHRALNALLENLFDLAPGLAAPDYRAAAGIAWRTTSKRSLVLFLTNLRDEDGDEIQAAVQGPAPPPSGPRREPARIRRVGDPDPPTPGLRGRAATRRCPPVSQRPPPHPRGLATPRRRGPRRRATSLTGGPRQPLSRHQAQRAVVTPRRAHRPSISGQRSRRARAQRSASFRGTAERGSAAPSAQRSKAVTCPLASSASTPRLGSARAAPRHR